MASGDKDHEAMISSTVGTPYMASGQKSTVFTRLPALTLGPSPTPALRRSSSGCRDRKERESATLLAQGEGIYRCSGGIIRDDIFKSD